MAATRKHPEAKVSMESAHLASWVVCVVMLLCCSSAASAKTEHKLEKKTDFGIGVQVAHGLHQFHSTCIWSQVFFISDRFFKGLRKRETSNGLEFTKDNRTYHNFPDRLIVDVQVSVVKCHPSDPDQMYPLGYGEGLMSEPAFELHWKGAQGNLRPVTVFSVHEQHPVVGMRWDYFLEISSKDTPLTDRLLGDISLRKGMTHIQFSASIAQ